MAGKRSAAGGSGSMKKRRFLGVVVVVPAAAAAGLGLWALFHATPDGASPKGPTARTLEMVQLLGDLRARELHDVAIDETRRADTNPWFVNRPQTIPTLRDAIAQATTLDRQVDFSLRLVNELLWDGRLDEALQVLGGLRSMAPKLGSVMEPSSFERFQGIIRDLSATCFLRMGERQNCVDCTSGEACLLPIRGDAIHKQRAGSEGAIAVLTESLRAHPDDLGARWLLNLAHMTLGDYPAKVPAEWLIPESAFASEYDIRKFHNEARARGVDAFGLAGGSALEDFDGDEDLDLFASGWSLGDQLRYFANRGDGTFEDRTEAAGLKGEVGGLNIVHADYDNDGRPDLLVIRGGWLGERGTYPPSLLHNLGGGRFEDVTHEAGILYYYPGQAGAWGDFDNDGWLDLFLGHEDDGKGTHPCQLFHNNRDGTFRDWAPALGLARLGFVKGAAWGDFDNDGLQDLYVSCLGAPNHLFRNEGKYGAGDGPDSWKFADVTSKAGVQEPLFSFATWFFDYDNDGWLDIFAGGFSKAAVGAVAAQYLGLPHGAEVPRLYRNKHDGTFEDVTKAVRLDRVLYVMAANFGDLDNDGFLDIYLGTGAPDLRLLMPNRMFRNAGGKVFQDVTTSGGFGHLQKGHGIAFGDIDGDGDQDIYAVMGGWYTSDGFRNALFVNPGHGNHWLTLRLEGVRSNRSAIGARIKVTLPPGAPQREIHVTVGTGGSFGSSSLQQEVGLGSATEVESVEVTWPATGKKQALSKLKVDQVVRIREE